MAKAEAEFEGKPCLYCGEKDSCRCTYHHMRKGTGGTQMWNTHPQKFSVIRESITEMISHIKADADCVFKISITKVKGEDDGNSRNVRTRK